MISGPERSTIAIPASSAGRSARGKIGLSPDGIGVPAVSACRSNPGTTRSRTFGVSIGTDKLAGVLSRLEQRRCRLEQPRDPRSMGLFRRLVREALPKIAVENGGPNLKQKMSAPL